MWGMRLCPRVGINVVIYIILYCSLVEGRELVVVVSCCCEGTGYHRLNTTYADARGPPVVCPGTAAIADEAGVHTSEPTPVYHIPKDECGGGSAYAAGIIDRCAHACAECAFALRAAPLAR